MSAQPTRHRVLHLLRLGPATIEQASARLALPRSYVREAVKSLRRLGQVRATSATRLRGDWTRAYELTIAGRDRLEYRERIEGWTLQALELGPATARVLADRAHRSEAETRSALERLRAWGHVRGSTGSVWSLADPVDAFEEAA